MTSPETNCPISNQSFVVSNFVIHNADISNRQGDRKTNLWFKFSSSFQDLLFWIGNIYGTVKWKEGWMANKLIPWPRKVSWPIIIIPHDSSSVPHELSVYFRGRQNKMSISISCHHSREKLWSSEVLFSKELETCFTERHSARPFLQRTLTFELFSRHLLPGALSEL